MALMAKPRSSRRNEEDKVSDPQPDAQARIQFNLRLPVALKTQLQTLADQNLTDITAEIIAACLDRLKSNSLWPPK